MAFSAAKNHFALHALEFDLIQELKEQLPRASFGKGCARVKYTDVEYIPALQDAIARIVARDSQA